MDPEIDHLALLFKEKMQICSVYPDSNEECGTNKTMDDDHLDETLRMEFDSREGGLVESMYVLTSPEHNELCAPDAFLPMTPFYRPEDAIMLDSWLHSSAVSAFKEDTYNFAEYKVVEENYLPFAATRRQQQVNTPLKFTWIQALGTQLTASLNVQLHSLTP